jgi:hypothetical protein
VTDDRFDDYVDEESISDFAADDVDAGGNLETAPSDEVEADGRPDVDAELESAIDLPEAGALPDATGVSSVDAALTELAPLDELPTSEHVAVYEGLHRQLQDALADLDGS